MINEEVAEALATAGSAATAAGAAGGIPGIIASITGIALSTAAGIAKAGGDPVREIERLLSSRSETEAVHSEWADAVDDKFGVLKPAMVDVAPDTQPAPGSDAGEDVYEDE